VAWFVRIIAGLLEVVWSLGLKATVCGWVGQTMMSSPRATNPNATCARRSLGKEEAQEGGNLSLEPCG